MLPCLTLILLCKYILSFSFTEEETAVRGHRHDLPKSHSCVTRWSVAGLPGPEASSPAFSKVLRKRLGNDKPEFWGS